MILVLTFKSLHQQAPKYLFKILQLQTGHRQLCSTSWTIAFYFICSTTYRTQNTSCHIRCSCLFNLHTAKMESATTTHRNATTIITAFKILLKHHESPSRFFKAILRDVMREEKFYFSLFFNIHLCNDPCCYRIISPQCNRAGYFA